MGSAVTVVIITRNRAEGLRQTLAALGALPERPPVVVVDNASTDATRAVLDAVVAEAGASVRGLFLSANAGAAGRNAGVEAATTPLVAFSDDDSWWAPGALAAAAGLFERHPRLGLLAAQILVGPTGRLDPVCLDMRASPFGHACDLPGPNVLGFIACGAIVRRQAFLQAGGFHPRYEVGGEERLLAIDLARRGWGLAYCDDVVAHHHPDAPSGPRPGRRARMVRNDLWTAWLRGGHRESARFTSRVFLEALKDREARRGLVMALRGIPWVLRERIPVGASLRSELRQLG